MVEYRFVASIFESLTAVGALALGLLIGLLVAALSKFVGSIRLLSDKRIRSLHIELGGSGQSRNAVKVGERSGGGMTQQEDMLRGGPVIRQWYMDEVPDEILGFN
jgi:hypothetical protein